MKPSKVFKTRDDRTVVEKKTKSMGWKGIVFEMKAWPSGTRECTSQAAQPAPLQEPAQSEEIFVPAGELDELRKMEAGLSAYPSRMFRRITGRFRVRNSPAQPRSAV